MALPRSSALRSTIRSFTIRRTGTQARSNLRTIGRRTYASGHEAKSSSDIPWLIGSLAATVPAAVWLWQQGPAPSEHGHGHESHGEEEESHEEEPKEVEEPAEKEEGEESKDDSSDESKEESDDDAKSESSSDEDGPASPPKDAKVSQKKGDKDAASDETGAKNPLLEDDEKSRKSEGVPATAKIHGTVDSARSTKGQKPANEEKEDDEGDSKEE